MSHDVIQNADVRRLCKVSAATGTGFWPGLRRRAGCSSVGRKGHRPLGHPAEVYKRFMEGSAFLLQSEGIV